MSYDDEGSEEEIRLFYDLADRLKLAHRRVAALPPEADKQAVTRRLLAISDAAKHDMTRASSRLDRLLAELPAANDDKQEPPP